MTVENTSKNTIAKANNLTVQFLFTLYTIQFAHPLGSTINRNSNSVTGQTGRRSLSSR